MAKPNLRDNSLLDSKYYQSALKINFVESNRLHKLSRCLKAEKNSKQIQMIKEWDKLQNEVTRIEENSGQTKFECYKFYKNNNHEKEEASDYYVMYGKRIKKNTNSTKNQGTENKRKCKIHEEDNQENERLKNEIETKQTFKDDEIMVDGDIYSRKRIGYDEQYKRLKTLYVECTEVNTKASNTRIPKYYLLKHKYIIPPVQMKDKNHF